MFYHKSADWNDLTWRLLLLKLTSWVFPNEQWNGAAAWHEDHGDLPTTWNGKVVFCSLHQFWFRKDTSCSPQTTPSKTLQDRKKKRKDALCHHNSHQSDRDERSEESGNASSSQYEHTYKHTPPCAAEEISLGIIKGDFRRGGGVIVLPGVLAVI